MFRAFLAMAAPFLLTGWLRADGFDLYTNPVLQKTAKAEGVKELKQLTPKLANEHQGVVVGSSAALIVVQTNDGRLGKLLVQFGKKKLGDEAGTLVPILILERFTCYKEGTERNTVALGQNVYLFDGFRFSVDMGQVVPEKMAGDLQLVAKENETYLEPVGKAKLYLLTKALPDTEPKKVEKFVMGEKVEPKHFTGKFKLHDDGRRSGMLVLKVADDGVVSGSFTSDKDGQEYPVAGKVGTPKHSVQFNVKYPRAEQAFTGWLFTGTGLALAGTSKMQDREAGFYALRVEE